MGAVLSSIKQFLAEDVFERLLAAFKCLISGPKALTNENDDLRKRLTCKNCDKRVSVFIYSCGHMACRDCTKEVGGKCFTCDEIIQSRIFMNHVMGNGESKHKDYYRILGVHQNATDAEITKAFRLLSMKYHPDKNNSSEAEAKFKDINEAYHILVKSKNSVVQYEAVDKNIVKTNLQKVQERERENTALHGFFTCSKCAKDISNGGIIFQCGHMSCVYCSNTSDDCHKCQQRVEQRQNIFL